MMDGGAILVVFVVLLVVAVFAGIGIGLVIGLAIWGKGDEHIATPPIPDRAAPIVYDAATAAPADAPVAVEGALPALTEEPALQQEQESPAAAIAAETTWESRSLTSEPVVAVPKATLQPARHTQSWSVALAIGIILICCFCTFMLAVIATLAR